MASARTLKRRRQRQAAKLRPFERGSESGLNLDELHQVVLAQLLPEIRRVFDADPLFFQAMRRS